MYIKVNADGKRFALPVPNCFLTLGIRIAVKALEKEGSLHIDKTQLAELSAGLKEARRVHGKMTLVDVKMADGDVVKIVL